MWVLLTCSFASFSVPRSSVRCPHCPWCGCCLPVPLLPSVYPGALWGVLAVHGAGAAYLFLCFLQCTQELCEVSSLSMVRVLLTCSFASFSVPRSSVRCPRCWCALSMVSMTFWTSPCAILVPTFIVTYQLMITDQNHISIIHLHVLAYCLSWQNSKLYFLTWAILKNMLNCCKAT